MCLFSRKNYLCTQEATLYCLCPSIWLCVVFCETDKFDNLMDENNLKLQRVPHIVCQPSWSYILLSCSEVLVTLTRLSYVILFIDYCGTCHMYYVKACASYCDIVVCIRMRWWVAAAVPQMKLMKHTVICSMLLYRRLSTWLGEHLVIIS